MEEKNPYDVIVESVGLNWEPAGPLFERYTVGLTGRLDRRWAACYNRLAGAAEYARFRLDPGASNVTFTTRSTDGPIQVMGVLKKLEALVASVNRQAGQEVATERQTKVDPDATVTSKPRLSELAARLRLTRSSSG